MTETIVEVVAVEASSITIDVIAPPPVALVVDVADWGTVPVTYPQLPVELRQLPMSFPIYGKPTPNSQVHVPIAFPVHVPPGLAGTRTYARVAGTDDRAFSVAAISNGVETEIGTVTLVAGSNTVNELAGSGGRLAIGDVLCISAPPGQDPTLSDVGITLLTERE